SQTTLFHDASPSSGGGFFSTPAHQSDLLLRLKSGMDAAEPSTNGISVSNLYRLASFLDDDSYANLARGTLGAFESEVLQHPFLFASLLPGIVVKKLGMRIIVVTGQGKDIDKALGRMRAEVAPTRTVVRLGRDARSEWLKKRNKLVANMNADKPGVWVCEGGTCREESDADTQTKS
ncbi:MAG: hypothetical protein M1830_006426, partial [Pleopsidium flavum]